MMLDDDRNGEKLIAGVSFQVTNKNEVNSTYKLSKSVEYIKWFPYEETLANFGNPGAKKPEWA
jgi:hypothetical protein